MSGFKYAKLIVSMDFMKLATSYQIGKPLEANKSNQKPATSRGTLKAPTLQQVLSQNILFGTSSSKSPSPTLEPEIQALKKRAPRMFGTPFVPKSMMPLLKKRALYNLNSDPAELTQYLPYRQRLVQKNERQDLQQYDQLVKAIMNKAEFYEVEKIKPAKNAVNKLYNLSKNLPDCKFEKYGIDTLWKTVKLFLSSPFNLKARHTAFKIVYETMNESARDVSDQTLSKQLLQSDTKPLNDLSTRYLIASSITELLFKNPEQAKKLLNNPAHPLRFVVGKGHSGISLGQFKPGFNLIFLNEESLWSRASKGMKEPYTSQHEFVHALSDVTGGELLPSMSEEQKRRFLKARSELEALYSRKDAGITGWLRILWNRHRATGLSRYAFFNHLEFLTVTSDTFKSKPEELCRTQAGREIYQIYKDIFKIDPLQDFKLN